MRNILGPREFVGRYKPIKIDDQRGVYLKMYEKDETKPQRKMGHINIIDLDDAKDMYALMDKAEKVRRSITFERPA